MKHLHAKREPQGDWERRQSISNKNFLKLSLLNEKLQSFKNVLNNNKKIIRKVSQPVLNMTTFQTCMWFNLFYTRQYLHLLDLIIYDFYFYCCFMMGMITIMSIYSFFTLAKAPQTFSFSMHLTWKTNTFSWSFTNMQRHKKMRITLLQMLLLS